MQALHRCRNLFLLQNSTHLAASFHATPISFKKINSDAEGQPWSKDAKGKSSSKNYIRYETREKRSDTKKALNDLLFKCGCSRTAFEGLFRREDKTNRQDRGNGGHSDKNARDIGKGGHSDKNKRDRGKGGHSDSAHKKCQSESSARHAAKAFDPQMRWKDKRDCYFEDIDDLPETCFKVKWKKRHYTCSFKSEGNSSFESSTYGFEWRENPDWTDSSFEGWASSRDFKSSRSRNKKDRDTASTIWSDGKSYLGSSSDRKLLGLPLTGPLEMEEVKTAFRVSALKWHPDKHQGSSKEMAEEKFKDCVDAYKSLCNALA